MARVPSLWRVVLRASRRAGECDIELYIDLDVLIRVFDDFEMLLASVWVPGLLPAGR